jgi:hypothetical protein
VALCFSGNIFWNRGEAFALQVVTGGGATGTMLLRSFQTATESTEAQKIQKNAGNSASVSVVIIFLKLL